MPGLRGGDTDQGACQKNKLVIFHPGPPARTGETLYFDIMVDNSAKIAALKTILESGAHSVSVDGLATVFRNRDEIVAEIDRLQAEDTVNGYTKRRRAKNVDLSQF